MTSIQKTEQAIKNGEFVAKAYRVYKITASPLHLRGGIDFGIYMSFDNKADADAEVAEINASGFEVAVCVHAA